MAELEARRDHAIQYYANVYPENPVDNFDDDDNWQTVPDPLLDDVLTGKIVAPTSHIGGELEAVRENLKSMRDSQTG